MIRVRCYYRYSSDEQSDGWSIEAQDKACRGFIKGHSGWELDGNKPYIDEAWSGKTVHRPAFQQMLQDAHDGKFDVLVCHKLDRFSRSLVDVLLTLDDLQKCHVTFASATEPIDFTTPIGRMMLVILAYFAEWYLQNLSAETTKGKVARFEAGYWNGDLRFGYSKAEAGEEIKNGHVKKLYKPVPNGDAHFVTFAYELGAAGKTDQEVADELNRLGARTYRLISNSKSKAGPEVDPTLRRGWVKDSVGALFNREAAQFYMGNMMYVGEKERKKVEREQQTQIRHNTHEPIIPYELYERAMAARRKRVNAGNVFSPSNRVYLLGEGIARCENCGEPLRCVYGAKGSNGGHYLYYRCAAWLRDMPCAGSRRQIREDALALQLEEYLALLQLSFNWPHWPQGVKNILAEKQDIESLIKRRTTLQSRLRRLNYQFEHGLIEEIDIPVYEKRAQRLIREINSIVITDTQQTIDICQKASSFKVVWSTLDPSQRHIILKEMVESIYVNTNTKKIVGIRPSHVFMPVFRQTLLIEIGGRFIIKNEEAVLNQNISEQTAVWSGSDGRRVFARREGFRARPLDSTNRILSNLRLAEPSFVYQTRNCGTSWLSSYSLYRMRKQVWIRILPVDYTSRHDYLQS